MEGVCNIQGQDRSSEGGALDGVEMVLIVKNLLGKRKF